MHSLAVSLNVITRLLKTGFYDRFVCLRNCKHGTGVASRTTVLQTKDLGVTKIKEFWNHLQNEKDTVFPLLWKSKNDTMQPKEIKRTKANGLNSIQRKNRIFL